VRPHVVHQDPDLDGSPHRRGQGLDKLAPHSVIAKKISRQRQRFARERDGIEHGRIGLVPILQRFDPITWKQGPGQDLLEQPSQIAEVSRVWEEGVGHMRGRDGGGFREGHMTLEVAAQQPYIHRLTRLGAAAQEQGRSLPFVDAISRVLWDGSVAPWNEGDHLARAAAAAGFDLPAMDAAVAADPDRFEAIIADNEKAHAASGHWGVPTFVFENEPFFGQDRIDLLIWRMESRGLVRRS